MIHPQQYDLAIVGGGLAGLSLAIQCADAGYSTLLVEKEQYPFHKVCGEYISLESWDFLEGLGLPLSEWELPIINQLEISDASGKIFDFHLPLGGFGVSRYKLDCALYQLACQKGVNVLTQTKVQDIQFADDHFVLSTTAGSANSLLAAASFGKRSNLDIKWRRSFVQQKPGKLDNYIGVKYHVRFEQKEGVIALHNFPDGYCGISKVEEDICCLCYLTTAGNLQKSGNSIQRMEKEILFNNPRLKEIFTGAAFIYKEPLVISQVSFQKKTQVEDHVLMIGDAAGMITPLCGNGMSMALQAAKIVFGFMEAFLQKKISREQMEKGYEQSWQQQFEKRLWWGRAIQRFFGNKKATSVFLRTMDGLPLVANRLIKATHGNPF